MHLPFRRSGHDGVSWQERVLDWLGARRPRTMVLAVLFMIVFGTIGYMLVGQLSIIDALYMAVVTVSTVGYTNLVPTPEGRLFSVIYIILGVAVVSVTISSLAAALVAGRVREALGRIRMERHIQDLSGHIVLCGYGRFGQITAAEISTAGVSLVVIDRLPEQVSTAESNGVLALLGDATEEGVLERAGIARAKALLCTLASDADNVYTILNARELRTDMPIIALARDRRAESKLLRAGATGVVSPYEIGATHMARRILTPGVARLMGLATGRDKSGLEQVGVRIQETAVEQGSSLAGLELRASPIRREFGVIVVAVISPDGPSHFNPDPGLVLSPGDVLVCMGPPDGLDQLARAAHRRTVAP